MPAKTTAERQRERHARLHGSADQSDLEAYKKAELLSTSLLQGTVSNVTYYLLLNLQGRI